MNRRLSTIPLRVLLLEDNPADATLLQAMLEREGYTLRVTHVATREAFLEHLGPDLDVILSDHALPQFNALQALELVQQRQLDIPFIIVSGVIREEAAVEAMRLGAADYLLKDRITRLGPAVRNALLKRQHRLDAARAQEAIRQSEALNRSVLASLDAQIAVVDGTGCIISVNEAWEQFAIENGNPKRVQADRCTNYLNVCQTAFTAGDDSAGHALQGIQEVLRGDRAQFCLEYPCHSPTVERWFEMRVTPLVGVDGGGAVISHTNITERKRAEETDRRLASIVSNSNDAIVSLSPSGTVLSWNAAAERIYGYTEREAVGQSLFDLTVPEDRRQELIDTLDRGRSGESIEHSETARMTKDGRRIDVSVCISPLLNNDNRVAGTSIIGRDISERKRYERGLIEAKEHAEEMSRLKSTFLNNMSHEFRTPLSGILGCAEVLAESLTGEDQEFAQMIQTSGSRLMETLNAVLELASLERGDIPLSVAPYDPVQHVEEALHQLKPQIDASGLRVAVQPPERPFQILADHDALKRVLLHVIGNAVKFTREGGVTLSFDVQEGRGRVKVADTGVGISRDFLPHLFQEFKQESAGLGRNFEGSGLGMALSQRLVGLMGGAILVESEKGKGSTFTIALPVAAEGRVASAA